MTDDAALLRFYDEFADDYHLAYAGNWDAAVERQGAALDALIRDVLPNATTVLDCSCGIGTQALGLARLGYSVVGSDISSGEIERAQREAERMGVEAKFVLADFRDLGSVEGHFDVVISCDNAIPHLLDESDVPRALAQMRAKTRPGGLLVITMRDFDRALAEKPPIAPPVVLPGSPRRVLVRLHDWDDDQPCYTVRYLLLNETDSGWTVKEHSMRYRAITRAELTSAAETAGLTEIEWPSDQVIVGGQLVMTARASSSLKSGGANRIPPFRQTLLALVSAAVLTLSGSAYALRLPSAPRCPIFPADNAWNQRVDSLPVASNSAPLIASIGAGARLHPDFGSGLYDGQPIGIPFDVVTRKTPRSAVSFGYADESDRVRYPIPKNVHVEGGRASSGDRHAILVDRDACRLYELYALYPKPGGGWKAGSGATWSLRSDHLRPAGWTSADAAGLPIFPGLARYDEVKRGVIDHALRFTVERTRRAYVYPARHYASDSNDPSLPPMGLRVRLKASFDVSGFPPQARVVLVALKRYGMIVADNGSNWYISGAPDPHWSNDDLHSLGRVKGSDFEVVDTSSLPHPGS